MADGDILEFEVRKGRVTLKEGKLFRGGVYPARILVEGAIRETALLRLYDMRQRDLCLVECQGVDGQVALNTTAVNQVFRDGVELVPLRAVVYDGDQVIGDGTVMLYWSPTAIIVEGKPIDTKGEDGAQGPEGPEGKQGPQGDSLYDVAQKNGYQGTPAEWVTTIANAAAEADRAEQAQTAAEEARRDAQIFAGAAGNIANSASEILEEIERAAWYGGYTDSQDETHQDSIEKMVKAVESSKSMAATYAASAKNSEKAVGQAALNVSQIATFVAQEVSKAQGHATTAGVKAGEAVEAYDRVASKVAEINGAQSAIEGMRDEVRSDKNATSDFRNEVKDLRDEVVIAAQSVAEAKTATADSAKDAQGFAAKAETAKEAAETTLASVRKVAEVDFPVKVQEAEETLDGKVTEATTAIDGKVTEANDAKDDAVKAKGEAETAKGQAEGFAKDASTSATRAEIALNNGCVYEVRDIADASFTVDKTITIYKHEPIADTAYNFATPTDVSGKVCVFWLWIAMGETAVQLTMPTSVTFIGSEPSFGANSETMLAFMSTDGGASWMANVQWEKAVSV